MSDANHYYATGVVERDAEMKTLPNGNIVTNFLLRINDTVTTRDSQFEITNVVKVLAWGGLAERTRDVAKVGERLCIHGRIRVSEWEGKCGHKHYSYEIILTKIKTFEQWAASLPSPAPPTLYPEPET